MDNPDFDSKKGGVALATPTSQIKHGTPTTKHDWVKRPSQKSWGAQENKEQQESDSGSN